MVEARLELSSPVLFVPPPVFHSFYLPTYFGVWGSDCQNQYDQTLQDVAPPGIHIVIPIQHHWFPLAVYSLHR